MTVCHYSVQYEAGGGIGALAVDPELRTLRRWRPPPGFADHHRLLLIRVEREPYRRVPLYRWHRRREAWIWVGQRRRGL